MRSHKNSILQGHTFKNRYMVMDFHVRANADMDVNVNPFPNVALCTNDGMLTDMDLTPDACSRTNMGLRRHFCLRMNIERCIGHLSYLSCLELVKYFRTKGSQRRREKNPHRPAVSAATTSQC